MQSDINVETNVADPAHLSISSGSGSPPPKNYFLEQDFYHKKVFVTSKNNFVLTVRKFIKLLVITILTHFFKTESGPISSSNAKYECLSTSKLDPKKERDSNYFTEVWRIS